MTKREVAHFRLERETVQAMDLLASLWNVSRQDAAQRMLDEAIRLHGDELVDLLNQFRARWLEDGNERD